MTEHEMSPAICVFPPILSWIELRDKAAAAGYDWKNEENIFAHPKAINSWFALISYLWFLADNFASDNETA